MGSLWGHLDEGLVFAGLGLWWMFNILRDYLRAGGKDSFVPRISYVSNIFGREIPVEIYLKIFFSIGGALIEVIAGKHGFLNGDGSFRNVSTLQHISIYCLFFTHAVLDLLRHRKWLHIDGLVYMSAVFSFMWYGVVFHFHTQHHSDKLETIVHTMGMLWCFGCGISGLWEYRSDDKFLPSYCRSLMVLGLGTWFIHTPFLLFSTDSFPGLNQNPRWQRDSDENYQVVATLFGFHLCFNIILSVIMFAVLRCLVKPESILKTTQFRRIPDDNPELMEKSGLLSDDDL